MSRPRERGRDGGWPAAAVLVTLAVGTVRILQLRRLVHRGRRAA